MAHVLQVQRAQEEGRVHAGDQEPADDAGADEAAQPEDAQGHDGVLDPRLQGDEQGHEHGRECAESEDLRGAPAMVGGLDDRVDGGHQGDGDQDGAEPVDAVPEAHAPVLGDELPAERHRGQADGEVDEEDPVPAQRLGEGAAGQQAERAAGHGGEHVGAHRAGALTGLREFGDDDRQDHGRLHGGADALDEACGDEETLAGGGAAEQRGDGEDDESGEEHALAAEQVAEPAGEEQEAAEGDEEGVDDPGQVALAEMQIALDRGQRHIHDRGVEHDHELRQADNHEGHPPAVAGGDGCGCGGEVHTSRS